MGFSAMSCVRRCFFQSH